METTTSARHVGALITQRRSCARLEVCLFNEASLYESLNGKWQKKKKTLGETFTVVEKQFQTPKFMFDVLY